MSYEIMACIAIINILMHIIANIIMLVMKINTDRYINFRPRFLKEGEEVVKNRTEFLYEKDCSSSPSLCVSEKMYTLSFLQQSPEVIFNKANFLYEK